MKKLLTIGLAALMITGSMAVTTSCSRSTTRSVSLWPGDRNVTTVKKPKRRKIKGRKKAVRSTSFNRVRR